MEKSTTDKLLDLDKKGESILRKASSSLSIMAIIGLSSMVTSMDAQIKAMRAISKIIKSPLATSIVESLIELRAIKRKSNEQL